MPEEKKDPCADLSGIEKINCMEKQAIGHTVSTERPKGLIASTPPAKVTATTPARVDPDEDEELRRRERIKKFLGGK